MILNGFLRRSSPEQAASSPAGAHDSDPTAANTPQANPPAAPAGLSFAQRRAQQAQSAGTVLVQGNEVMRSIDRPLPGDVVGRRKSKLDPEKSRKRSAYFESQFAATKEDPALARVRKEAMVVAELKTNVIVNNEFTLITQLAKHLAHRYQRPVSSINVVLQHSVCMLFSGSVEPACTLIIHALPSLVQPATNRRNAMLLQMHLNEALGVIADRCYIRFEGIREENFGIGGKTLASKIEEISARNAEQESAAAVRKSSKSGRGIMKTVKSLGSFRSHSGTNSAENAPKAPPHNSRGSTRVATIPEMPPTPPDDETLRLGEEEVPQQAQSRRRKSLFTLFGSD